MKDINKWKQINELNEFNLPNFPIKDFPNKLREYIEAVAEELQVPIDMVGTGVLAILALCNQGKYVVQGKEGWLEPLNLYAINIARPSERKSPTMARITKPIYEYEKEENERRKLEVMNSKSKKEMYENKLKTLKNKCGRKGVNDNEIQKEIEETNDIIANFKEVNFTRLIVDDITPEALVSIMSQNKERIGIFSAEGGIFDTLAGRYSSNVANFDIILKSYSGDTTSVDRKGRATETLKNPYLTMLLFIQPVVAESLFKNEQFRGKGICARFLYCYPKSKVGYRNVNSKAMSKETEDKYKNIIEKLLQRDFEEPKVLNLSEEAYNISQKFAEYLEENLQNKLEEIEEWAGKFHGNILRIAGNLQLVESIESDNPIITEQNILNSIELGLYYLENAKYVYKTIGIDKERLKAKKIVKKLKNNGIVGNIKKYAIFRMCRGTDVKKPEDIDEALEILQEEGYIRIKEEIQENKVGRPPDKIIELNPYFFK